MRFLWYLITYIFRGDDRILFGNEPVTPIVENPVATIQPVANHWGIFKKGQLLKEYTRRRDAVRGAKRLGLAVA